MKKKTTTKQNKTKTYNKPSIPVSVSAMYMQVVFTFQLSYIYKADFFCPNCSNCFYLHLISRKCLLYQILYRPLYPLFSTIQIVYKGNFNIPYSKHDLYDI